MDNKKVVARIFTISDYEEEEIWLRQQHQKGWKLQKTVMPCFYIFEKCTPEDVAYRLDYKNNTEQADYFQIFQDYGWEYFNRCMGWLYFRKPIAETDSEQDAEIFSDDVSRVQLLNNLLKTRMLPLLVVFFCGIVPNMINSIGRDSGLFTAFVVLFVLYVYLFLHCGRKLWKLKKKYGCK